MREGWEIKKLGEVANYFIGLTYSPKDVSEKGTIVLRSSNIQKGKLDFSDIVRVSKTIKEALKVKEGDILMCSRNGSKRLVGKTAKIEGLKEEMTFGTFMTVIRSRYNSYLLWFFKSDEFRKQIGGGENPMINQITKYMLDDVQILFPTLPEQQRIVSILDEAFGAIAKAKANAEQNLKNAKELFESYLQGVFENKGEGWEEKLLKEIGVAQTGTTPKTAAKDNYGDFIPFIKPADVDFTGNGEIRYHNEGLSEQGLRQGRKMMRGSILMVCIGATIGKVGFVDRDVSCNQQINSLTVNKEFYPKFIYYALSTENFFQKVINNAAQATLPIINKGKWERLAVSLPKSLKEQQYIVKKLDALSAETKKLEAIYQKKIENLEELKKAVLGKAFRGELCEQDFKGLKENRIKKNAVVV
jgi:type I restriction enzyme S subunit